MKFSLVLFQTDTLQEILGVVNPGVISITIHQAEVKCLTVKLKLCTPTPATRDLSREPDKCSCVITSRGPLRRDNENPPALIKGQPRLIPGPSAP